MTSTNDLRTRLLSYARQLRDFWTHGDGTSLDTCAADAMEEAVAALDERDDEIKQLRQIIADFGYCVPSASIEFMSLIPTEVEAAKADLRNKVAGLTSKYEELLYAVSIKHPQEDRHETALRYIRQAEQNSGGPALATHRDDASHD